MHRSHGPGGRGLGVVKGTGEPGVEASGKPDRTRRRPGRAEFGTNVLLLDRPPSQVNPEVRATVLTMEARDGAANT